MFLSWFGMTPGLFQPAKRFGGAVAKPQKMTMQPVPKQVAIEWRQFASKLQSERPMTGAG
jgi:hypothetical protein